MTPGELQLLRAIARAVANAVVREIRFEDSRPRNLVKERLKAALKPGRHGAS